MNMDEERESLCFENSACGNMKVIYDTTMDIRLIIHINASTKEIVFYKYTHIYTGSSGAKYTK